MPKPAPLLDDSKYRTYYQQPPTHHHQQNQFKPVQPTLALDLNTFDRPGSTARPQSCTSGMLATIPQHLGTPKMQDISAYLHSIAINKL